MSLKAKRMKVVKGDSSSVGVGASPNKILADISNLHQQPKQYVSADKLLKVSILKNPGALAPMKIVKRLALILRFMLHMRYLTIIKWFYDNEVQAVRNRSEHILNFRAENGMVCRPFPVKETNQLVHSEDEDGNKMINEYIREYKIGSESYGKVALYRSSVDEKHYAIKVLIMKMVEPSIG